MATERESIAAKVAKLEPWFHNFQVAQGVWTNPDGAGPGADYPDRRWKFVAPLLPDVAGKSCLDVGCSSGFFALKLKELGASYVLGVDSGEQSRALDQARFAADTLRLDVDFRAVSAYDLGRLARQFDVVLFMGVFYHLRHPLLALEAVRSACRETMILQTVTTKSEGKLEELDAAGIANVPLQSPALSDAKFPGMRFVEGALSDDVTCWFVPNLQAVTAMARSCGFTIDHVDFPTSHEVLLRCTTVP